MRVNYIQPIMGLSLLATVHQLHNLDVAQAAMDACSDSVTRTILCVHSVHFLFKWLCCLFRGIMTASLLMGSFIRLRYAHFTAPLPHVTIGSMTLCLMCPCHLVALTSIQYAYISIPPLPQTTITKKESCRP